MDEKFLYKTTPHGEHKVTSVTDEEGTIYAITDSNDYQMGFTDEELIGLAAWIQEHFKTAQ